MRRLVVLQRIGNRGDHFGAGKHAELDRTDTEIVEACVDLRAQEGHRRHVHGRHPTRVLRGQRGNRGQGRARRARQRFSGRPGCRRRRRSRSRRW